METANVENVVDEVEEQSEKKQKNGPIASLKQWPFELAVFANRTARGGTSHRVQLSVSSMDQNGDVQTNKVYCSLRDASHLVDLISDVTREVRCSLIKWSK